VYRCSRVELKEAVKDEDMHVTLGTLRFRFPLSNVFGRIEQLHTFLATENMYRELVTYLHLRGAGPQAWKSIVGAERGSGGSGSRFPLVHAWLAAPRSPIK
jgi:hypothetical protein